jgi:hypothetical protein
VITEGGHVKVADGVMVSTGFLAEEYLARFGHG